MKKIKLVITAIVFVGSIFLGTLLYNHLKESVETKHEMKYTEVVEAKDFEVQTIDGQMVKLSDFKDGKPIVINFWSHKCSPCVQEMPTFEGLYDEYKDQVHFLMINTFNDISASNTFIDTYHYSFPVYHDVNRKARKSLYVPSLPTTYIIDQNFNVVRGGKGVVTYPMVTEVLNELLKAD